ncbi:hypothetical protein J6590_067726 [Homalodisca vitripennis]|nr:hypothetical protein J6590_067726 [Homalodisca vitripennis]
MRSERNGPDLIKTLMSERSKQIKAARKHSAPYLSDTAGLAIQHLTVGRPAPALSDTQRGLCVRGPTQSSTVSAYLHYTTLSTQTREFKVQTIIPSEIIYSQAPSQTGLFRQFYRASGLGQQDMAGLTKAECGPAYTSQGNQES